MSCFFQRMSTWLLILLAAANAAADNLSPENGDIHDIYGPVPLSEPHTWLYYLAAALVVLGLLLFIFILHKKRKLKPIIATPVHEKALAELDIARSYLEQNHSLKYAQKVSEILRNYLEMRFSIHSTRQTTAEFLASLDTVSSSSKDMLQPHRKSLQRCLEQCDLAKYAHKTARQETMEQLDESVRTFINETTPTESV